MANEIGKKIAKWKPKSPRKETIANKDTVQKLAGQHQVETVAGLRKIANDPNAPATARVSAYKELLDRTAGKASKSDDEGRPEHELDKMSVPELVEYINQQFSGWSMSARAALSESIAEGIAFDAADLVDIVKLDEPAEREPKPAKPKREPRR